MTDWILDASPVILLGKIQQLPLIRALSPGFRIPRAVADEIGAGSADDPAVEWLKQPSVLAHVVEAPAPAQLLTQWDLGAGESAVLSLALAEDGTVAVLDDLAARRFALAFHIPLVGTLGLLVRAKHAGLVGQLGPLIEKLESAGANLSPAVVRHALELALEAPSLEG